MAKQATYLLRITSKGVTYYLSHVSANGCNVEFDRRMNFAVTFTLKERAELAKEHSHIRGRWVLKAREMKRMAGTHEAEALGDQGRSE